MSAPSRARSLALAALAALALAGVTGAAAAAAASEPVLTMEEALALARAGNHVAASASLAVEKSDAQLSALRTRRLPLLHLDALGLRLLEPLDFTFAPGTFGTFPQIGPVPPVTTAVRTPADWTAAFLATVSQPLTQQYRIGLGIRHAELERELASEQLRGERQRLAAEVRASYHALSSTQAGVEALQDVVRALEEVDALTARYLREQLVLPPDALEVQARLARERHRLGSARSALATQREHLNQLLGREITTPFRVADPAGDPPRLGTLTLGEARDLARARRPEIREAATRTSQAETGLRLAYAEWIPDVTLAAAYAQLVNYRFLPGHVAMVGLVASWEPFDWGRRGKEASARAAVVEQARHGLAEAQQRIAVEVGMRWRALRDAGALLEATRLGAEAARANLELVTRRYQEDARVLRDVLQAQAQLSGARHDFTDAQAGYWSAAAELERAIGDDD